MLKRSVLAIGINMHANEKKILLDTLGNEGITLKIATIKNVVIEIVNSVTLITVSGVDICNYDYVWLQSSWNTNHIAYILHLYLKDKKIPHNKPITHQTKLSDIFSLAKADILVPNTYFHASKKIQPVEREYISEICKFPCIYKTLAGSLGSGVHQILESTEFDSTIKAIDKSFKYLFQQFIPNDFDYRVIVVNGKQNSICKRIRDKDLFRNNVALGAREEFTCEEETPAEVIEMAVKAAKILRLKWAGVDIIVDKETRQPYILEVNRRPGLTESSLEPVAALNYLKGVFA